MDVFWRKGFANTSISDLTDELNINRFSLYNTYGDKQQLYYEALDTYLKKVSLPSLNDLEKDDASLPELESFLKSAKLGVIISGNAHCIPTVLARITIPKMFV